MSLVFEQVNGNPMDRDVALRLSLGRTIEVLLLQQIHGELPAGGRKAVASTVRLLRLAGDDMRLQRQSLQAIAVGAASEQLSLLATLRAALGTGSTDADVWDKVRTTIDVLSDVARERPVESRRRAEVLTLLESVYESLVEEQGELSDAVWAND